MRLRTTAAALGLLATLAVASPASADVYAVGGLTDAAEPPPCQGSSPNFTCTHLRSAVQEANQTPVDDIIVLAVPGEYAVSAGQLTLSGNVTIGGDGPDTTAIVSNGQSRVFAIAPGATADLTGVAVRGGSVAGGINGGNFLVNANAQLTLTFTRVSGGAADRGAGIANSGTVTINASVVDGNVARSAGGAVSNEGSPSVAPQLHVINSTLAANTAPFGGAVYSAGNPGNAVRLTFATVGRNTGGGLGFDAAQTASADASIIATNGGPDCQGATMSGSANVESGATCGLTGPSNRQNADPGLSPALVDVSGEFPTQVLTIPATSPAVDLVSPCYLPYDQRLAPRFSAEGAPCDAGAYEVAPSGGGGQPPPQPTPTATPVPTAMPTPTPTPTPVAGKSVGAEPVSGKVLVRLPGSGRFVPLEPSVIPNGAEVDTRDGEVEISRSDGGVAKFRDGIFKISQTGGLTTLTLSEKLTGCPKQGKASAAATKPKSRKLWGDGKGRFRTKGQYAAATVRGTEWLVQDTCTTTFVRVKVGAVTVRDDVKKKTIVLGRGKTYTARARR